VFEYPWAMKRLAARTVSLFRYTGDMLFSYGEISETMYILVNGWVTLSIGRIFEDANADMDNLKSDMTTVASSASSFTPTLIQVRRRIMTNTFDNEADDLALRSDVKSAEVFNGIQMKYKLEEYREKEKLDSSSIKKKFTRTGDPSSNQAFIQAPAFFGETVLWFDDPPARAYGARCKTRAELITITKTDVEEMLEDLPYVRPSFDNFKAHMLGQAEEVNKQRHATSVSIAKSDKRNESLFEI
jgi:CRP-like cAMP-binding protein